MPSDQQLPEHSPGPPVQSAASCGHALSSGERIQSTLVTPPPIQPPEHPDESPQAKGGQANIAAQSVGCHELDHGTASSTPKRKLDQVADDHAHCRDQGSPRSDFAPIQRRRKEEDPEQLQSISTTDLSASPIDVELIEQIDWQFTQRSEALDKREEAIDKREEAIDKREEAIDKRKEAIDKREEAIDEREEAISKKERALNERALVFSQVDVAFEWRERQFKKRQRVEQRVLDGLLLTLQHQVRAAEQNGNKELHELQNSLESSQKELDEAWRKYKKERKERKADTEQLAKIKGYYETMHKKLSVLVRKDLERIRAYLMHQALFLIGKDKASESFTACLKRLIEHLERGTRPEEDDVTMLEGRDHELATTLRWALSTPRP